MQKQLSNFSRPELDRIIMMAWEDRTSFDAIKEQFGILPGEVIKLMRSELKPSSFKLWRRRTHGRITKHEAKFMNTSSGSERRRFRAKSQRG
ncbi:MAG: TIGR03643 family protein [Planctomycetota bacterium]|nr:TIGR03643 family protein [Planctomycetota bacterium]